MRSKLRRSIKTNFSGFSCLNGRAWRTTGWPFAGRGCSRREIWTNECISPKVRPKPDFSTLSRWTRTVPLPANLAVLEAQSVLWRRGPGRRQTSAQVPPPRTTLDSLSAAVWMSRFVSSWPDFSYFFKSFQECGDIGFCLSLFILISEYNPQVRFKIAIKFWTSLQN